MHHPRARRIRSPGPAVVAIAAAIAVWAAWAGPARAGDRHLVWRTIETKHFVIHYYKPLGTIAHRIGVVAERAYHVEVPILRHAPAHKTQIVITDQNDAANGFTYVLPRNMIHLYISTPTGLSSLNDYDDWLYGLVAHEFTHVLHLDSIGGLPAIYNHIFGKTWAPNQVEPRWIIEGIAVYDETKRTSGGRLRSSMFDTFLRTAVLAGKAFGLDAMSTGPRAFPHGNVAYLYGSHFLQYIFDRYGEDKLPKLSWTYGSDPIPYALNDAIAKAVGKPFTELDHEWRTYMRARYDLEVEAAERRGIRRGRRLTFSGESNFKPRYSRNGRYLVWQQNNGLSIAKFRAMPVDSNVGHAFDYATVYRVGGYDLLPGGSMVVEQTTNYRTDYAYQELYLWKRKTRTLRQLTFRARARDPAASPDGHRVAFVLGRPSHRELAVMPLTPEARYRVLWSGGRYDQAYSPAWSPDGRHIAFSAWRKGGYRDILIADVDTGKVRALWHDRAIDTNPVYDPDGRTLYFSSDRSGIYNIYAYDLGSGRLFRVTNVLGCALLPAVSPDGKRLAYVGCNADGYDLYEMPLVRSHWLPADAYVNDRPDSTVIPDDEYAVSKPRPYRPLMTLAPSNYKLSLSLTPGAQSIGVQTGGGDVVGLHAYGLAATLDLASGRVGLGAAYAYYGFWPTLRLSFSRNASRRGGVYIDGENTAFTEEVLGASASASAPLLQTSRGTARMSLDYSFDWLRDTKDKFHGYDPNQLVPQFPQTNVKFGSVGLSLSYSDARGFAYTTGPQQGQRVSLSLRVDHPALGSDFHALTLHYSWAGYLHMPWSPDAALAVLASGGIRTSDNAGSGTYVLGGVPSQNIINALTSNTRAGESGYLRGYPARAADGHQYHLVNVEYRQQVFNIEKGALTLPIYVRRLHFAGLWDIGNAFDGPFSVADLKTSLGISLRLDLVLGYYLPVTLDVGFARGLTAGGINESWLLLTGTL